MMNIPELGRVQVFEFFLKLRWKVINKFFFMHFKMEKVNKKCCQIYFLIVYIPGRC